MLARVAERMYWMGRYMERAENTARMVGAVTEMMLDAPRQGPSLWKIMVDILGLEALYAGRYDIAEERPVVRFLLADESNPSSILSSISLARENAGTSREILPIEAWEQVNDIYWYAKEQAAKAVNRNNRHPFLSAIVGACQLLNGRVAGTMSHDIAYHFIRLGRHLERADMTTRILDLGAAGRAQIADMTGTPDRATPVASGLWMSVLLCMSAYQMYHQHVQMGVKGEEVVRFLLTDVNFPRAVVYCVREVELRLSLLPHSGPPLQAARSLREELGKVEVPKLMQRGLREYLDGLQIRLANVHSCIAASWFGRPEEPRARLRPALAGSTAALDGTLAGASPVDGRQPVERLP